MGLNEDLGDRENVGSASLASQRAREAKSKKTAENSTPHANDGIQKEFRRQLRCIADGFPPHSQRWYKNAGLPYPLILPGIQEAARKMLESSNEISYLGNGVYEQIGDPIHTEPPKPEQQLAALKGGDIRQAAQWMSDGRRVKRAVWSDDVHDDNYHRHCLLYKNDRRVMTVSRGGNNWSAPDLTVDDLLANDWEVVEEKTGLDAAVEKGRELGKMALYFGCWREAGHYLHDVHGRTLYGSHKPVDLPWDEGLMDGTLLKNGKVPDNPDGRVFWTAGGLAFWYAFYWWDRSIDTRGACNSGFYVRGFGAHEEEAAFAYACEQFPHVVKRQKFPLVLQLRKKPGDTNAEQGKS